MELGFTQSKADPCLFHLFEGPHKIIITTWVDDCIVSYDCETRWKRMLQRICGRFKLGAGMDFEWCLGMAVDRNTGWYYTGSCTTHRWCVWLPSRRGGTPSGGAQPLPRTPTAKCPCRAWCRCT